MLTTTIVYSSRNVETLAQTYVFPDAGSGEYFIDWVANSTSCACTLCMFIPKITTGCGCRTPLAESGTGYWRFILWIGHGKLVDSAKNY